MPRSPRARATSLVALAAMLGLAGYLLWGGGIDPAPPPSGGPDAGPGLRGGDDTSESALLERALAESAWIAAAGFSESALEARLRAGGVALGDPERAPVLALLQAHLRSLRTNLESAGRALAQGEPAARRSRYVAFAAQAHGTFQRRVRELVSADTARSLFDAVPSLLPPTPRP